jgi:lipopolysaccharide biosynthesis regulator YciM
VNDSASAILLAVLIALLAGLTIGKAWERYKLRGGQWIDRRRARESPHYILGLNFLVSNQIDLAIEELTRAASVDADALEVHMILGNLYREKGQVGKAITVHQSLLQRAKLTQLEHAYVLLCLGLDYKRGGFVDRALDAFKEVLRLDPKNEYALVNLQKMHEEQHQWSEAYDTRQRLAKLSSVEAQPQNQAILAFLENEIGLEAVRRKNLAEAAKRFQAAIDLDPRAVPAYLNLGDLKAAEGNEKDAASIWERVVEVAPDRAYLAFDRLEAQALRAGAPERFPRLCRRLIADNPQDWRARLALSRHLTANGRAHDALELLFAALVHNPHALSIHRAIWRTLGDLQHPPGLVHRYADLTDHAVFYLDPHICLRCRYRSTELLWQCPHCHDWNTFVEERIAPAQDTTEVEA